MAVLAGLLTWSPAVFAQQEYILTDEDQWKPSQPIDPASPAGQLAEARRALASGEPERAEYMASGWIERNPRDPLLPDAYILRGDAKAAMGDEYEALYDYEYVARMFPGSEAFVTANQRELEIARKYAAGLKRKQWGVRWTSADKDAEELFIRIQERLPGSRLAEEAGMELADYYFTRRQMGLATEAYSLFIENYPRSTMIDKARRRLIYSYLATFKGPEFNAQGLMEARGRLVDLEARRPAEAERMGADALLTRIDESDAQKILTVAKYYMQTGDPISAEFTIRRLVKRYPHTAATAEALRFVPKVLPKLPARILDSAPDYAAMAAAIEANATVTPTADNAPIGTAPATTAPETQP